MRWIPATAAGRTITDGTGGARRPTDHAPCVTHRCWRAPIITMSHVIQRRLIQLHGCVHFFLSLL